MNDFLLEEEKEFKRFYKLSLWWVEHHTLLKKIGIGAIVVFDAVLILFILWNVMDVLAINYGNEQREVERVVVVNQSDLHTYTMENAAQELENDVVRIFSIGDKRYDFFTNLSNPNLDWWAEFTYKFIIGELETEERKGFILPGQEKPVVLLAHESETTMREVELRLVKVDWHRLNHKLINNYESWSLDRLDIEVTDQKHTRENQYEKQVIGRTTFTAKNKTAYSYYDPVFYILLKNGSTVVGVNTVTLQSFDSGEEESVLVNWFGTLPSANQVTIIPDINLFDIEIYKPLSGETSIDTRTRVFQ